MKLPRYQPKAGSSESSEGIISRIEEERTRTPPAARHRQAPRQQPSSAPDHMLVTEQLPRRRTMSDQKQSNCTTKIEEEIGALPPSSAAQGRREEEATSDRKKVSMMVGLTCLAVVAAAALTTRTHGDQFSGSALPLAFTATEVHYVTHGSSMQEGVGRPEQPHQPRRRRRQLRRSEPVHLLYSSDDRSLQGVEASIRSVLHHASEDVVFHFVGDSPLRSMPYVNYYNISDVIEQYHLTDFINTHKRHNGDKREGVNLNENMPNYVRFVMDDLLPNVEKAMWIDSDTIVKCDVVELVRNVLNDKKDNDNSDVIAAVPVFSPPTGLYKNDRNGNPFPDWGIETSFNAGVYVVHLSRWREQKISDQIRDLALRNRKYRYYEMGSQPPLVLTVGENFEHLPLSWNVKMKTVDEREGMSLEDACVLHWSGPSKPWDGNGQHLEEWLPYHIETADDPSADGEEENE